MYQGKSENCVLDNSNLTLHPSKDINDRGTLPRILIIAAGRTVQDALKAVDELEKLGISPAIVNARFIKPLDAGMILKMTDQIHSIITVEEHVLDGGFGSAVLELLADCGKFDFRVRRIGIQDRFVEHGPQNILRSEYGIDSKAIVSAAKELAGIGINSQALHSIHSEVTLIP